MMTRFAAMVFAALPAMGAADGIEGRWAMETRHPAACESSSEGPLTVDRFGFETPDAACAFATPAPEGFQGMFGAVECRADGAPMKIAVDLLLEGERLFLAVGGGAPMPYLRC